MDATSNFSLRFAGAVAGMIVALIVCLDPDMISGIQETKDRTNDSRLVTFQAPPHQYGKAIL